MITSTQAGKQIAAVIEAHIAAAGVTRKHVFTSANMSRDKFDSRMKNGEAFTLDQLIRIAAALRVPAAQLFQPLTSELSDANSHSESLAA